MKTARATGEDDPPPSVLDLYGWALDDMPEKYRFVRPMLDAELADMDPADPNLPTDLNVVRKTIRRLTLKEGDVIPFHMHRIKEKTYVFEGNGVMVIGYRDAEGDLTTHTMCRPGQQFTVRAGTWHCVTCEQVVWPLIEDSGSTMIVVASTADVTDISWEANLVTLLQNNHRKRTIERIEPEILAA